MIFIEIYRVYQEFLELFSEKKFTQTESTILVEEGGGGVNIFWVNRGGKKKKGREKKKGGGAGGGGGEGVRMGRRWIYP